MANANLKLSDGLVAKFVAAQKSSTVRWIQSKVTDVTFDFVKQGDIKGSLEDDLAAVKSEAFDAEASFVFLCVDVEASPKQWVLVAYVPETAKVKTRMLYASGRDDVKAKLGHVYFRGETHCSEASDLSLENVLRLKQDEADLPYSFEEMQLKEEHAASARPMAKEEKGMADLEFPATDKLKTEISKFSKKEVEWIEVEVSGDEKLEMVTSSGRIGSTNSELELLVDVANPRFYLALRRDTPLKKDVFFLVFSCPDAAPIKKRMIYASCKQNLVDQCVGVTFDKLCEIRSPDELHEAFTHFETPKTDAGKITHEQVNRPAGPARRRRPTKK